MKVYAGMLKAINQEEQVQSLNIITTAISMIGKYTYEKKNGNSDENK